MTMTSFTSEIEERGSHRSHYRKGKTIFPTGEDRLEVGDQLLVTTLLPNITKIYDLIER